ncbi:cytochrome b-c1 complex subunit 2, mitochondrial-like [Argiope bruennichi]|uniref:cytochrome b-c1 complex subunit 2, mitochondrial-like n=1 Tax=Argiope bruennichi TaxID=94029 RepID=UPI0024959D76|nr:cytochrome b-c1 complex subunit 2, mitochondrial-like [Argiope bruennichi]
MNANRFRQIWSTKKNFFSTNKLRPAQTASQAEADVDILSKQDAQVSQISSGITVASVENYSPITRISAVVKAGSRYETPQNTGIVHLLRHCAVLSTKNHTAFALTRNLEMMGAKLNVTSTRDNLIYNLKCSRDNIDDALAILADVVSNPTFKPWEVEEASHMLPTDLALHQSRPESVLFEALHKAAFRGGLANSLYSETFMIGKHNSEMLHNFVHSHFTPSKTAVVGLGISHEDLEKSVGGLVHLHGGSPDSDGASKFAPGEIRIEADLPLVYTAVVAEGASAANMKDALSFGVLQCILGLGNHIQMSSSKYSALGEAAAKTTTNPFYVSGLNVNYSDTGLFGAYIVGQPQDMKSLVKAVVTQMKEVTKNITDSAVENAKHKLKAKLLLEADTSDGAIAAMALDASMHGKVRDDKELERAINELKLADIKAIAGKVMKAKPAMASLGRLHHTPHVDELL